MEHDDEVINSWMKSSGWFPGRDVGMDNCGYREMVEEGWEVTEPQQRVLRECTGLVFDGVESLDDLWIDGRRAPRELEIGWAYLYKSYIGVDMIPIGAHGYITIMCDAGGRFWGSFDGSYELIGESLRDVFTRFSSTPKRPLSNEVPKDFIRAYEEQFNFFEEQFAPPPQSS